MCVIDDTRAAIMTKIRPIAGFSKIWCSIVVVVKSIFPVLIKVLLKPEYVSFVAFEDEWNKKSGLEIHAMPNNVSNKAIICKIVNFYRIYQKEQQ